MYGGSFFPLISLGALGCFAGVTVKKHGEKGVEDVVERWS
jgi:hypothetical protein